MAHGLLVRSPCRPCSPLQSAIAYCHERRIVHRDVKTESVSTTMPAMLTCGDLLCRLKWQPELEDLEEAEGNPFDNALSDFGLAIQLKEGEELTEPAGSPAYAAPEAMSGQRYGLPADMWSVGCVHPRRAH